MNSRWLTALPVYNEVRYVDGVLDEVSEYSPEILVVDDGSTDGTAEVLSARLRRELPAGDHPDEFRDFTMRPFAITGILLGVSVAAFRISAEEPEKIDVAAFGRILLVPRDDPGRAFPAEGSPFRPGAANRLDERTALHIEWTEPRDVREMAFSFQGEPPDPSGGTSRASSEVPSPITVQWWRRIWPDNGSGGWMKLDDPFNGGWTPAKCKWSRQGSELRLEFLPLDAEEAPGIQRAGAEYRKTYKLRVSFARPTVLEAVEAFTGQTSTKTSASRGCFTGSRRVARDPLP